MKNKKILLLLLLICLFLGVASACSKEAAETEIPIYSQDEVSEEEVVIQNDNLELHFDPVTTHFYVVKKSTGYTWYSNPTDAASDTLAAGAAKAELDSTIMLKYNTESGSETNMNNFESSIEKGNYSYEVLDNGIKVNYTIADLNKVFLIPLAVPESRFNEFFSKMDKGTQSQILNSYKVYDINNLGSNDNKDNLLAQYPDLANEKIYVLRDSTQEYLKKRTEEFFAAAGYTQADYEADAARYSTTTTSDKPIFDVTIQYELNEDGLVVTVPLKDIMYKQKYPIVEIKPLAFFGAGGTKDEGFMLVPDGSGAVINFNNKKTTQLPYKSDVYGWDYGIYRDSYIDETRADMPIFGISKKDVTNNPDAPKEASFICVLEEGNSYAYIEADISGRMNSYNYATANYNLVHDAMMDISAKSDKTVRMFQDKLPDENISQRYVFLDNTDYTSMAAAYRDYLMAANPELVKRTNSDVPVAVELIGAVTRTKHVFGIPTRQPDELTSYKEAKQITEQLKNSGITDLSIKLNGFYNKGLIHTSPNKVKLLSELGSKKDFKNLVSYADQNNIKLYLEAAFQLLYSNNTFDNFVGIRDSAKYVNRKLIDMAPYNPIFFGREDSSYIKYTYNIAKPKFYLKNMEAYADEIADLGVKNISFRDIGQILSADYDPKHETSREKAKELQVEELKKLDSEGYGMMINSGNIYAVPYSDFIVNVDLGTKGYNIIDEEVPFYEIALHGLVSYAGDPINLSNDYIYNLLKTAETGAGLYFTFMGASSYELQDSKYLNYFSCDFSEWSEDAIKLYDRMKADFGNIYNQYIVDHRQLANGVYMTQYEDGTQVIVNYNEAPYTVNGKEVPAKDYIVEGGKQ